MKRLVLIKLPFVLAAILGASALGVTANEHQHMHGAHDMSAHDMSSHSMSDQAQHHEMSAEQHTQQAATLSVLDAWIRLTPPVAKNGAAYFVLHNTGKEAITVVGVTTPLAEMAAMHDSVEHKGMMTMKHLMSLPVPAESKVAFAPGGKHLMLINLNEKLEAGKTFPVTFRLENGATVMTTMPVK